jgi:hypothetical protein
MSTLEDLHQQLPLLINQLIEKGIMTEDEGDALLNTIMTSNLSQGDLNALILDLSREAGLSVVTDTIEKVARWRKIIIGLMLAGITGAILESGIPGIYYTLYEKIYTTVMLLFNAGIPKDQIREFINNRQSIQVPSIPNPSGLLLNLKDTLITGFFIASSIVLACINVVCSTAQTITEKITIDNFKFTADLAAQMATPVGITFAVKILKGSYDKEIAVFIDSGAIQSALGKVDDTVIDVKRSIAGAVSESAIDVDDMKLGIKWSNLVPNRRNEPSTDASINNEIERAISDIFSDPNKSAMFSKIEMLNDILEVLRSKDKQRAIQSFTVKYRDTGSDRIPILLTLLTAPPVKKSDYGTMSQPDPTSYAMPGDQVLTRQSSLFSNYKYPVKSDDPNAVKNEQVAFPLARFDVVKERADLQRIGRIPSGKKETKKNWNKESDRFLYEFINVWINDNDAGFVQKLNFLSPEDHNRVINEIIKMARDRNGYELVSSVDDPRNKDKSYEELTKLFDEIYRTIKILMDTLPIAKEEDLAGGRHKKSRHYKKRRMTQRKHRVKGRRTRKGKKKRSTKRRR